MKTSLNNIFEKIDFIVNSIEKIESKLKVKEIIKPPPKKLSINEAVKFFLEQGFPVSKSKLYKLTSEGKIPYDKFGIRVLFRQDKLIDWIENEMNLSVKSESKHVMILANSARRKK
jgi:excisionase family DNA binding protein